MGGLTAEEAAIMKRVHENESNLEASLDVQEKELLHTVQNDRLDVTCIIEEKRFRETFCLGEKLMMEILASTPQ